MSERFALSADVLLVPVERLSEDVRGRLAADVGDYALTRLRSRSPSSIVDAAAAALLEEFRTPKTIVEAVIRYSRRKGLDPEATLEGAFPLLQRLIERRMLVTPGSEAASDSHATFTRGDSIVGFLVTGCLQVLEDSELYQVRSESGRVAALKIARRAYGHAMQRTIDREVLILKHLDGRVSPRLLEAGAVDGLAFLVTEWCSGVDAAAAAAELRHPGAVGRPKLLALCCAILDAYAHLHAQGVIHGDVHPRNLLVGSNGTMTVIDYGLACLDVNPLDTGTVGRGGIGFFFEPEYATACLARQQPPSPSALGEQYALAALVYFLVTGAHYCDFSLEATEMLRQIAEAKPIRFERRGAHPWPAVEEVLITALHKRPADRFESVAEFATALRAVAVAASAPASVEVAGTGWADHEALATLQRRVLDRVGQAELAARLPLTAPTCSVNYGATGIAYALYRMACINEAPALLAVADVWAVRALRGKDAETAFSSVDLEINPDAVGRVSPYHTASGVHAVQAMIGNAIGDPLSPHDAVEAFVSAAAGDCTNLDLTLGQSSVLLYCALLADITPTNSALRALGNDVLRGIWDEIVDYPPVQECSELSYLGIAHGWAGVLYATILWCESSHRPMPASLGTRLEQLADCAELNGRGSRWPISNGLNDRAAAQYMSGWCHGSAGYVFLWSLAHGMLREPRFLTLAEAAAWNTWETPNVNGSLCCGLAGQAYSLLKLYRSTGDEDWLQRAQQLAALAAAGTFGSAPHESLYKGELGVAVLAADLSRPEWACMPLFEREPWPAYGAASPDGRTELR